MLVSVAELRRVINSADGVLMRASGIARPPHGGGASRGAVSSASVDDGGRFKARDARAALVKSATPEYNGSIPGQLKNAQDWASRPRGAAVLEGKPVATLSTSPSRRGGAGAQEDLRNVLAVIGAEIRGAEIAVPHVHEQFDEDGGLVDQELRAHLHSTLVALVGPVAAAVSAPAPPILTSRPRTLQALAA